MSNREKKRDWERHQGLSRSERAAQASQVATRPITADDPAYLQDLKEFVEGQRSWSEWHSWWKANASTVRKSEVPRLADELGGSFPSMGAMEILSKHRIAYVSAGHNWSHCPRCGEKTLREGARIFCPGQCWGVILNMRPEPEVSSGPTSAAPDQP